MPRLLALFTLALAFVASSPALAQSGDKTTVRVRAVTPARPRGRPNHAALYGYPHNRGDHSGVRQPAPVINHPMSPGGYVDSRPANTGSHCRAGTAFPSNLVKLHDVLMTHVTQLINARPA